MSEQMPKPPILSDEELEKVKSVYIDGDFSVRYVRDIRGHSEDTMAIAAEAQRDADAEYYEGKLEQVRAEVLKAIEDEPEFPGDMPDEAWSAIKQAIESNNTRKVIQDIMRNVVKMTKSEITKRLSGTMPDKDKE